VICLENTYFIFFHTCEVEVEKNQTKIFTLLTVNTFPPAVL